MSAGRDAVRSHGRNGSRSDASGERTRVHVDFPSSPYGRNRNGDPTSSHGRYEDRSGFSGNPRTSRHSHARGSYANAYPMGNGAGAYRPSGSRRLPSKAAIIVVAVLVVLLMMAIALFSLLAPSDRIPKGIHVGDVDVSDMTVPEATAAIDEMYLPRLRATTIYVYADEETANSADVELQMIENEAQAEQLSFDEAQRNKKLWVTSAESLHASLPSGQLAQEALDLGNRRGLFERINADSAESYVKPRATYDTMMISSLVDDINSALGSPVENYDLEINEEGITVQDGSDGFLLNNEEFLDQLSDTLLVDESALQGFVADIQQVPYVIDEEMAEATKNAIEESIPETLVLTSDVKSTSFSRDELMKWVSTRPVEQDGVWFLEPYLNPSIASPFILQASSIQDLGDDVSVTFEVVEDDNVMVRSSKDVSLPNVEEALQTLDNDIFGAYRTSRESLSVPEEITVGITMDEPRSEFSLDEALSHGLVTEFSSFTTQFANTASTANRRDNIHLVSDVINNSIAKANGGKWSFLEQAGSMEEEDGYKAAGVIVSGKMDQGIAGGVCQVATTVFNAVYQAGLGIDERHNHTLYSSSYPAGLDAAIASPTLDLIWTNSTSSDVLMVTSYTDYSVTVTLIGIDPELEVETERGDWQEGKEHKTEYEVDEDLASGASYVKTSPTDGMEINVRRIVNDKNGERVDEDLFVSVYDPVNRVIAYGKGSDLSQIKSKYAEVEDD